MNQKKFAKKHIPKPLNKEKKPSQNNINFNRKLSFSRNENYLLNKYSNSQKSTSRTDLVNKNNNITSDPSSKFINNEFPKRKLNHAKTFLEKLERDEKKEKISKIKQKKVKNLQLFIKLVDENEKIENEFYYGNKSKRKTIKYKRNKSDIGLYVPCVTYNKKNIYFNKKYDLIQKKCNFKNNSFKVLSSYSSSKKKINKKINSNFSKENIYRDSSLLIETKENEKINIATRKKMKSNTMILNKISPCTNDYNFSLKQLNTNKLSEKNVSDTTNSFSNNLINTEFDNNNNILKSNKYNKKRNGKYSFSVKSASHFFHSKSKEKIKKNKIFPMVSKIIEESSKIEKDLKYKYRNLNDCEKKEKDKKKKINEVNNLIKRRKLNIDALRRRLNLDKNYFEGNKKNNCFDVYDILIKNTNKMKKMVPKNGINVITEAANKIIYEDKRLNKDIVYYNERLLGQFKENKKDKILNKIYESQKKLKKAIIGKSNNNQNELIQLLKNDIFD